MEDTLAKAIADSTADGFIVTFAPHLDINSLLIVELIHHGGYARRTVSAVVDRLNLDRGYVDILRLTVRDLNGQLKRGVYGQGSQEQSQPQAGD